MLDSPIITNSSSAFFKRRTAYDIAFDILEAMNKKGIGITRSCLIRQLSLSCRTYFVMDSLLEAGFVRTVKDDKKYLKREHIAKDVDFYIITDKGKEYVEQFKKLTALFREDK